MQTVKENIDYESMGYMTVNVAIVWTKFLQRTTEKIWGDKVVSLDRGKNLTVGGWAIVDKMRFWGKTTILSKMLRSEYLKEERVSKIGYVSAR